MSVIGNAKFYLGLRLFLLKQLTATKAVCMWEVGRGYLALNQRKLANSVDIVHNHFRHSHWEIFMARFDSFIPLDKKTV